MQNEESLYSTLVCNTKQHVGLLSKSMQITVRLLFRTTVKSNVASSRLFAVECLVMKACCLGDIKQ